MLWNFTIGKHVFRKNKEGRYWVLLGVSVSGGETTSLSGVFQIRIWEAELECIESFRCIFVFWLSRLGLLCLT